MKSIKILLAIVVASMVLSAEGQQKVVTPELTKITDPKTWESHNREVTFKKEVHLDARPGDGLVWLKDLNFSNGRIELDIRGRDEAGRSFVGLAFHGLNAQTYDAIYFRPFNFKNPQRSDHSVQYISHPENTWDKLRAAHPGKYEHAVNPVPDPNGWFHAVVVVEYPVVKVYVNNSDEPSLTVNQLSSRKEGWIGFWTGNNSEGDFRDLKITMGK
jgi:hypothetical protein